MNQEFQGIVEHCIKIEEQEVERSRVFLRDCQAQDECPSELITSARKCVESQEELLTSCQTVLKKITGEQETESQDEEDDR